jgi:ribosomal-protein-alanine N-acetyltransferase
MEINITPMQLVDLDQIKDILLEEFDDFWTFSMLKQELENTNNLNSTYFVVKKNEEIVGFAGIIKIIDEITIMNIVVKKSKRKLGIGSALLQKLIDFSREQKATSITLEVNYKNEPAIALYQKFGFKQVGLRKKYYHNTDDAVLMTLSIL